MSSKDDSNQPDVVEEIAALRREVERLNGHRFIRIQNSPWRLLGYRFMSGLFTGLGTVIGATLLVSVLVWWLQGINWIPVIGDWAAQIATRIEQTVPDNGSGSRPATPSPSQP
jgi:hypothetical protein